MHQPILLVALAAAAAAAPTTAPAINFAAILSATGPTLTGPTLGNPTQTGIYNPTSAAVSASNAVTTIASAVATASVVARNLPDERSLMRRNFCIWGICFTSGSLSSSSGSITTGKTVGTSATGVTAVSTAAATTTAIVLPATSTYVVPSSCTPTAWTNTFAFTTATDCATPYEVGTYCGFINPEDPCAAQPNAAGAQVQPDTPEAFLAYSDFHKTAQSASTPTGYAQTFKDLNASVNANTYMGLYTLTSYDTAQCASLCDNTNLCTSFNIYIERDPAWNPDGCSCQNPASVTNYKCTLWGSGVDAVAAVNLGQTRDSFSVVITGSNGYAKTNNTVPATPSGWTNPTNCSSTVHNHPSTCLGQKFFPGPFDVNLCANYASSQNARNAKSLGWLSWSSYVGYNSMHCNFFNAYMVKTDGVPQGTYCSLFTQQYDATASTYKPGVQSGVKFDVESSWGFCSK